VNVREIGGGRTRFVWSAIPSDTGSVLDIGSGEGWVIGTLNQVPRRVGVDTDRDAIKRARERYPRCEYREIDGAALPFPERQFDVVILAEVLEHVGEENKAPVVDEALRVLKDGGRLILTVPHQGLLAFLDPLDYKRRLPRLYRAYRRLYGGQPQTREAIGHKHLSLAEVRALLGTRVRYERVLLSGWLSPLIELVETACRLLPGTGWLLRRIGELKSWESGVPAPRALASSLRLVAVKRSASG